MKSTREAPWMCVLCGYAVDAASSLTGRSASPQEGDYALCLNCGHCHVRHNNRWISITAEERAAMHEQNRREIEHLKSVRQAVVNKDLAKRGGRA